MADALQEVVKAKPLPDVITVPKQAGVKWVEKEKVWYRTAEGISEAHVVIPGR